MTVLQYLLLYWPRQMLTSFSPSTILCFARGLFSTNESSMARTWEQEFHAIALQSCGALFVNLGQIPLRKIVCCTFERCRLQSQPQIASLYSAVSSTWASLVLPIYIRGLLWGVFTDEQILDLMKGLPAVSDMRDSICTLWWPSPWAQLHTSSA